MSRNQHLASSRSGNLALVIDHAAGVYIFGGVVAGLSVASPSRTSVAASQRELENRGKAAEVKETRDTFRCGCQRPSLLRKRRWLLADSACIMAKLGSRSMAKPKGKKRTLVEDAGIQQRAPATATTAVGRAKNWGPTATHPGKPSIGG